MRSAGARLNATLVATAAILTASPRSATTQPRVAAEPGAEPLRAVDASPNDCTATGSWRKRKPLPQGAVFAGTVVGPDGRIYAISGNTHYDGGLTAAVHAYDPKTDTWVDAAPIPTPRTSPGAALGPDGKIYVLGGSDRAYKKDVVEAYDPRKNVWARLKPMPTPRDAPWAVAARGADGRVRIYVLGGRDRARPGNGMSVVEAYDPASGTWSTMAPMLIRLHAHVATLGPDGRIYLLGGTNDTLSFTDAVQVYDPAKNAWARGISMPYGQECAAVTSTPGSNGEILVFAGWGTDKRPLRSAAAFNPRTGKWRSLPPVPTARAAGGAVTIQGADRCIHVYVIGGTGEDGHAEFHPPAGSETVVEEYSFRPAR